MKCPTLIAALARDQRGRPCRNPADRLDQRGIARSPPCRDPDRGMGATSRSTSRREEYVLDYLSHSFPTQLFELYSRRRGQPPLPPAYDADGDPDDFARGRGAHRDRMVEHLASLPPVPGALDQILHRFGTDLVAEVTGRSRRIVRRNDRLCVETRPASANFAETAAFMDDDKRILVLFRRRRHRAQLSRRSQLPEPAPAHPHHLLEPGWKADAAIQGLGRSNRTNQKQPPVFRPAVAADVKGEKRFLSTIARRGSTPSAPSPAASARLAGRASSAPTTISKAPTPPRRCGSSISCCPPARSRAARGPRSRTRPVSISSTRS